MAARFQHVTHFRHWGALGPSRAVNRVTAAVLATALIAAGCGAGKRSTGPKTTSPTSTTASPRTNGQRSSTATAVGSAATSLQQAFIDVVAKVRPEVVQITDTTSQGAALGSGIVYDTKGDIVTNDHVVANGAVTNLEVQLADGQSLPATIVGTYQPDDLAVVHVTGARSLSPASFADSAAAPIGDIVLALGNPLGLSSSVTEGIISYNGRTVSEGNGVVLPDTIQTSAAINPGNSGGALVDLSGQVVGIPTLAATDPQIGGAAAGIGFAIPANTVKSIAGQLIATGKVTNSGRAGLGITASDAFGPLGQPVGAAVDSVLPGGPAARAGIKAEDVITAVNGHPVADVASLQDILAALTPGAKASLTVLTPTGARRTITVILGQLSD